MKTKIRTIILTVIMWYLRKLGIVLVKQEMYREMYQLTRVLDGLAELHKKSGEAATLRGKYPKLYRKTHHYARAALFFLDEASKQIISSPDEGARV